MLNQLYLVIRLMIYLCSVSTFLSIGFTQNPDRINYTNGDYVAALVEDGDYIWAGTNGGLVKIKKTSGETTFYNMANSGLPDNDFLLIATGGSGNKWIGTWGGGSLITFSDNFELDD